jgi:hypothetical protein
MSPTSNATGNPLNGGAGIASDISGTVTTYAGGGGGANYSGGSNGAGGVGGGGAGGPTSGNNGTVNTGGGGGGSTFNGNGASGGSGIVILRYPSYYRDPIYTTATKTNSPDAQWKIFTFTSSGSISF